MNKKIIYALPILYGIGLTLSKRICRELNFAPELTIAKLTSQQKFEIAKKIKAEFRVEENLKELIKNNIQKYMSNGSLRGYRHKHHLPVRGQRTHTNAKTVKSRKTFLESTFRIFKRSIVILKKNKS